MGSHWTFDAMCDVIHTNKPQLVFFSETKITGQHAKNLRLKLRFDSCVVASPEGLSGGLFMFWNRDIDVTLLSYNKYHIDMAIKIYDLPPRRFTGIYDDPVLTNRHLS